MLELAIVLFAVGLILIALEMFVPGGIVGTIGFISCVAAIYFAFQVSTVAGIVGIVVVALATPVAIYSGLNRASLKTALRKETGTVSTPPGSALPVGTEGVARTVLRPSGMATIDGKRVSVVTRGEMIPRNSKIEIIEIEGGRVVVRAVEEK